MFETIINKTLGLTQNQANTKKLIKKKDKV